MTIRSFAPHSYNFFFTVGEKNIVNTKNGLGNAIMLIISIVTLLLFLHIYFIQI
jgi:hypothetical protein